MSTFTVLNPATEEPVTTLTQASAADADEAIARAAAALPSWRAVSPGDRARMLRAFAAAGRLPGWLELLPPLAGLVPLAGAAALTGPRGPIEETNADALGFLSGKISSRE